MTENIQKPSIGRIVHVFCPAAFGEKPMAAIVADVNDMRVNVTAVSHDGGTGSLKNISHVSEPRHGRDYYWDWPARA